MANTEYNAYHIADNPKVFQPIRKNNFRVQINFGSNDYINQTGLLKPGTDDTLDTSYITGLSATDVIDFSVVSFKAPHFSQEEVSVKRGNSTVYFAGVPSFSEGSLVINDFVGADGKSILMAWQALSYDIQNDAIYSSDVYKVDATVLEYLPDNTLVKYWELKGCWIKSLDEDEWSADSGDKKTVTATIRFDKAIPHTV